MTDTPQGQVEIKINMEATANKYMQAGGDGPPYRPVGWQATAAKLAHSCLKRRRQVVGLSSFQLCSAKNRLCECDALMTTQGPASNSRLTRDINATCGGCHQFMPTEVPSPTKRFLGPCSWLPVCAHHLSIANFSIENFPYARGPIATAVFAALSVAAPHLTQVRYLVRFMLIARRYRAFLRLFLVSAHMRKPPD